MQSKVVQQVQQAGDVQGGEALLDAARVEQTVAQSLCVDRVRGGGGRWRVRSELRGALDAKKSKAESTATLPLDRNAPCTLAA